MSIETFLPENKQGRRLVGRLVRSRSGVAASEFAMILPLILIMLFGMLQYGIMMMTYNSMLNGARSAARAASLGDSSEAVIKAELKNWLPAWVPSDVVTVSITNVGTNDVRVNVSLPSANATVLRLGPMPEFLTASVVMAREA
jgi:Flp pilus assembly protein TadG